MLMENHFKVTLFVGALLGLTLEQKNANLKLNYD